MAGHTVRPGPQHARKFVFIGASYKFDHRVVRDFLLTRRFNGSTFTIVDIDEEPLKLVCDLAKKMVAQSGQDVRIEGTLDLDKALERADFVFPAFSVGGESAREKDAAIARKYGFSQAVGNTGPAGLIRALRKVPFAVEIAQHLHRHSSRGRIVNFTHPMPVITAAMARHSEVQSVIGLCHAIEGCRDFLARLYKVPAENLEVMTAGVNHLTWVMQVLIEGHDHTDQLDKLLSKTNTKKGKVADVEEQHFAISLDLWRRYGFLPVAGDEHVCEFFAPFTRRGSKEAERLRHKPLNSGKMRAKLKASLSHLAYKSASVPDMEKWSGEDAHSVILAMLDGNNSRHTVNMPHDGALGPGISEGALIECMASLDRRGARGVALGELPLVVKTLTQRLNAVHDLTVEAALEGDRKKVIQALLLDPSVVEFDRVPAMVDEYLKEFKRYLPRFWR